jgi:hypothetical protein
MHAHGEKECGESSVSIRFHKGGIGDTQKNEQGQLALALSNTEPRLHMHIATKGGLLSVCLLRR